MLSPEQRQAYWNEGFVFPIEIALADEVRQWHTEITTMRDQHEDAWNAGEINTLRSWVEPIAERPSIVNKVACLLGPNFRIQNVDVFVKCVAKRALLPWKQNKPREIDPHVDTHFAPPEPDRRLTIWIPLNEAKPKHGGLIYYARSHRDLPDDLSLSPRQVTLAPAVFQALPNTQGTPVQMMPGQMSMHHGRMVHSSGGNWGPTPRIALAIRYQGLGQPLQFTDPVPDNFEFMKRDFPVSWRNC